MQRTSIASRIASLAVLALGGCTMVLGIHKAEQDTGSTTTTGTGGGATGLCKTVAQDCLSCLKSKCPDAADCLKDSTCRRSLDTYNGCLDKNCQDTGACMENDISNTNLSLCMSQMCSLECADGAALSRCDLYCACMQNTCGTNFGNELGGTLDSCMAKCSQWTLDRDVKCRWTHCEFGANSPDDAAKHCPHAAGNPDVCIIPPGTTAHVCLNGGESGFPCDLKHPCCSGSCRSNVCD